MELSAGYQQTDVGVIPSDWDVKELAVLLTAGPKNGYSPTSSKTASGTPTLTLGATTSGVLVLNEETIKRLEESIAPGSDLFLQAGDVLIQRSNTPDLVGTTAVFDGPSGVFVYPDLMMRVRFADAATAHWFWRFANSGQGRSFFRRVASGSSGSMPKISGRTLRQMRVPVPSPAERCLVANAIGDVDYLIVGIDRLIAKKRDLRIAVMQQLLSGRTRLPGFSDAWEERVLGEHVRFLKNGVNPRADLRPEGRVRYLHYGDIHTSMARSLNIGVVKMPRLPDAMAHRLDRLEDGDLVFVDASEDLTGVGKSVEISGANGLELVSGLHTIAARFDKDVLADGFKGYLQFCRLFRNQLARLAQGTKVFSTTRQHISSVVMKLPGVDEQRAIATVLSESEREILALEALRKKTTDVKLAMSQELLTGKTRFITTGGANG